MTRKQITNNNLPKNFSGIKIIQLSDLHNKSFGKNNKRLIKRVKNEKPNYIMLTGDIISRHTTDLSSAEKFFKSLVRIAPVYCCLGNHETDLPDSIEKHYFDIMYCAGVHCLVNQSMSIARGDNLINIAGICVEHACYRNPNGSYNNLKPYTYSDIQNALGSHYGYTILLAHNPVFFDTYAKWGSELILSGHVHGGIIRIPFICGFLSPERRFFPKYTSGIYRLKNSTMMLSRGLGKLRLFNPPEIVVITLTAGEL